MATLYIDPVNGNDTNPAQVTNVTASQSGTLANIASTGHGLSTGAYVILNNFSTWLNKQWQITVVDANNFTLNGSVWQTTADTLGNYYVQKATSWANAWKTPNATGTNYTYPGDEIRIAKSPDPYSIGNATWTKASATVTLATAQNATIDMCETAWTAANGSTVTRGNTSPVKQGTYKMQVTSPLTPATATKYAYYTLPATLDLSAYQSISFYLHPLSTTGIDADTEWEIKLCSDTTGDVVVDTFKIPLNNSGRQIAVVINKDGGGNLGNAIKSIAIYSGTTTPAGSQNIMYDCFIACKSNGLNLTSLISKCNVGTYDHAQEPWYSIMFINGTTVFLDNNYTSSPTSTQKYIYWTEGTSPATVTTYARETIKTTIPTAQTQCVFSTWGTSNTFAAGVYTKYTGGWNTSNNTQDGMTFYDLQSDYGTIFDTVNTTQKYNFWLDNIGFVRGFSGIYNSGTRSLSYYEKFTNLAFVKNYQYAFIIGTYRFGSNYNYFHMENISSTNGICYFNQVDNAYVNNIKSRVAGINSSNYFGLNNSYIKNIDFAIHLSNNIISFSAANNNIIENISLINDNYSTSPNAGANLVIAGNSHDNKFYNVYSSVSGAGLSFGDYTSNNRVYGYTSTGNYVSIVNTSGSTEYTTNNSVLCISNSESIFYRNNNPSQSAYNTISMDCVNGVIDDNRTYISNGYATTGIAYLFTQTTTRHTASGVAWQLNLVSYVLNTSVKPVRIPIAKFAVNANTLVTAKAWVKLSDSSQVAARLILPGYQVSGVTTNQIANKTADTNWEELSISFTPTKKGVVELFVDAWQIGTNDTHSVYVDDVTITQA